MRADIIGAMKNAMDRGSTPQQAARSLINSGYPAQEVNEALNFIAGGTLSSLMPNPTSQVIQRPPAQVQQTPQRIQQNPQYNQRSEQAQYPQQFQQRSPQVQQFPQRPIQQVQQLPTIRPQQMYQQPQYQGSKGGLKTFLLFTTLFVLIAVLVSMIFFRSNILEFLG